ncbi:MAG: glycosyltransferase [Candidatus Nezhaarchaeales archaeon]
MLYVGRVNEKKGVEDLLSAFSRLKGDATLLVVGKCDEAYKRKLLKLVEGRKAIFTGEVPNSELPRYYNICDVLVMPSRRYEGIPRVILEAMATGKPVIASDVGGVKDVIKDGQTGLIFRPGDVEELYLKLLNLLRDYERRKAISNAAREFVVAEHSVNHITAKLADLMIKVAKS